MTGSVVHICKTAWWHRLRCWRKQNIILGCTQNKNFTCFIGGKKGPLQVNKCITSIQRVTHQKWLQHNLIFHKQSYLYLVNFTCLSIFLHRNPRTWVVRFNGNWEYLILKLVAWRKDATILTREDYITWRQCIYMFYVCYKRICIYKFVHNNITCIHYLELNSVFWFKQFKMVPIV